VKTNTQNAGSSQASKKSILNNVVRKPPKPLSQGRDFVIKQKIRR
jgi:hypothetical protein